TGKANTTGATSAGAPSPASEREPTHSLRTPAEHRPYQGTSRFAIMARRATPPDGHWMPTGGPAITARTDAPMTDQNPDLERLQEFTPFDSLSDAHLRDIVRKLNVQ